MVIALQHLTQAISCDSNINLIVTAVLWCQVCKDGKHLAASTKRHHTTALELIQEGFNFYDTCTSIIGASLHS